VTLLLSSWRIAAQKQNVSEIILDASVLLAILKGETYDPNLIAKVVGAVMSSVNLAEVLSKAVDFGMSDSARLRAVLTLVDRIEPFTEEQARLAGSLRLQTKAAGLSFGDRACLAVGMSLGATIYTADRQWLEVQLDCPIYLIR
jgi:PIN domain nuclease of toxin-antitoxin system